MSIELPKDADGREIPLDTEVLYDMGGVEFAVRNFIFNKAPSSQRGEWLISGVFDDEADSGRIMPKFMHLTPPDSWGKLEEDLDRAVKRDAVTSQCRYFNTTNRCVNCPIHNGDGGCTHKDERAFEDILNRIRKLRGED